MKSKNYIKAAIRIGEYLSKKGYLLSILLCLSVDVLAQKPSYTWFRLSGTLSIHKRLSSEIELQHRRQSTWEHKSPLQYRQLCSIRPWFHYQLHKHYHIESAPIALYVSYHKVQNEYDLHQKPLLEYRSSWGIATQYQLSSRLSLNTRTLGEYRHFSASRDMIRLRGKFGVNYTLNKHFSISMQEELLLNLHTTGNTFDQNRLSFSLKEHTANRCILELGYMHIWKGSNDSGEILDQTHNLYLNFRFDFRQARKQV